MHRSIKAQLSPSLRVFLRILFFSRSNFGFSVDPEASLLPSTPCSPLCALGARSAVAGLLYIYSVAPFPAAPRQWQCAATATKVIARRRP